jgi:shikimate kinase
MELLEKIKPTILKNIVGNKIQINFFLEVLKDENFSHKIILLVGPNGCGKTLISNLAFQELNFKVFDIQNEKHNLRELLNIITSFCNNRTIESFLNKNYRQCILLDNIDVLLATDRNIISLLENIYSCLEKNKIFLVITCKNNEEKKILELKNKIELIKINHPTIKDVFGYLSNKLDLLEIDDDTLLKLVNKYNGSIRDIILNIGSNDQYIEIKNSFKDLTQFEIIKKISSQTHSLDELMTLLKDDINMVSYLLYENIPNELYTNYDFKNSKTNIIKIYEKINQLYLYSSLFENYMYHNSQWTFYDLIQILKLHGTNIILNELHKKKTKKNIKYRYSQLISKLSHKNIMNKKIKGIYKNNNDISIYEMFVLSDKISVDNNINTNGLKRNKKYDLDECNFINTYQRYFE